MMKPVAPIKSIMFRSENPQEIYTYSPGICALASGRLIGTMDLGGPGVKGAYNSAVWGQIFVSDDDGASWRQVASAPFSHARPFVAGKSVYVMGHFGGQGDLCIMRSDDEGETWSPCTALTQGRQWHQAPANVCYVEDRVYLVMEEIPLERSSGWPVRALLPVLMRAHIGDDLTRPESWDYARVNQFQDLISYDETDYFGVPFYSMDPDQGINVMPGRYCAPIGWLETNVVHFEDENHIWCDPTGHTFHLFMRAHTGRTGYCCVIKVVEKENGEMVMEPIKAPSGKTLLYLPMPGGQMKFHILYDDVTKLYWLLSTQATDSMIRPEKMSADRYNLPDNERSRLQLHFSKNCVDWCFAALVDMGESQVESRHYASMCIKGDDLCILSRSGDQHARCPHNGNIITFHEIRNFRELVY